MGRNIDFIGTGVMGRGMASNLVRRGHSLRVYNRTRSKAEDIARLGAKIVDTPAEATRGVEIVVTMLADPAAVLAVMEGPEGVLSSIQVGTVVIDSSTVSPATTQRVSEQLRVRGAHIVDAPVFGSKNEAETAQLGFIVGADRNVYEEVREVLECMGKSFYVGSGGMGVYAKLVVNLIIAVTLQALNEGMIMATKAGIDPDVMLQIIQSSRARAGIIEMKAPQILKRDFSPFFHLRLMNKDLGLVMDAAHSLGVPAPLSAMVKEIYTACMAEGLAEEDFCSSIKFLEKISKVEVASAKSARA